VARAGRPVFLGRQSYRRRRLRDAAQLLPVLGSALWLIPLLWPTGVGEGVLNSTALLYVFGVWIGLILCALVLSLLLDRGGEGGTEGDG
jgi:Cu/Ag efflux pump CusA